MATAGVNAIDWWNDDERGAKEINALCDHLGWPHQYGEGEASHEWLTEEQMNELMGVTYDDLYVAEEAKPLD